MPPRRILFIDTETSGKLRGKPIYWCDLLVFPRLVEISWMIADREGMVFDEKTCLIRPDGFVIPEDASRIHGITTEQAMAEGIPIRDLLSCFLHAIDETDLMVAHNLAFDRGVIGTEVLRVTGYVPSIWPGFCTMESLTSFCRIPSPYGYSPYKWPTLSELHQRIFGEIPEGLHRADQDMNILKTCFFELVRRGVIVFTGDSVFPTVREEVP